MGLPAPTRVKRTNIRAALAARKGSLAAAAAQNVGDDEGAAQQFLVPGSAMPNTNPLAGSSSGHGLFPNMNPLAQALDGGLLTPKPINTTPSLSQKRRRKSSRRACCCRETRNGPSNEED